MRVHFLFSSLLILLLTFCAFFFLAATSFNIKGLTYYKNNEEDPYITLKDVCMPFPFPFKFKFYPTTHIDVFQGRRR